MATSGGRASPALTTCTQLRSQLSSISEDLAKNRFFAQTRTPEQLQGELLALSLISHKVSALFECLERCNGMHSATPDQKVQIMTAMDAARREVIAAVRDCGPRIHAAKDVVAAVMSFARLKHVPEVITPRTFSDLDWRTPSKQQQQRQQQPAEDSKPATPASHQAPPAASSNQSQRAAAMAQFQQRGQLQQQPADMPKAPAAVPPRQPLEASSKETMREASIAPSKGQQYAAAAAPALAAFSRQTMEDLAHSPIPAQSPEEMPQQQYHHQHAGTHHHVIHQNFHRRQPSYADSCLCNMQESSGRAGAVCVSKSTDSSSGDSWEDMEEETTSKGAHSHNHNLTSGGKPYSGRYFEAEDDALSGVQGTGSLAYEETELACSAVSEGPQAAELAVVAPMARAGAGRAAADASPMSISSGSGAAAVFARGSIMAAGVGSAALQADLLSTPKQLPKGSKMSGSLEQLLAGASLEGSMDSGVSSQALPVTLQQRHKQREEMRLLQEQQQREPEEQRRRQQEEEEQAPAAAAERVRRAEAEERTRQQLQHQRRETADTAPTVDGKRRSRGEDSGGNDKLHQGGAGKLQPQSQQGSLVTESRELLQQGRRSAGAPQPANSVHLIQQHGRYAHAGGGGHGCVPPRAPRSNPHHHSGSGHPTGAVAYSAPSHKHLPKSVAAVLPAMQDLGLAGSVHHQRSGAGAGISGGNSAGGKGGDSVTIEYDFEYDGAYSEGASRIRPRRKRSALRRVLAGISTVVSVTIVAVGAAFLAAALNAGLDEVDEKLGHLHHEHLQQSSQRQQQQRQLLEMDSDRPVNIMLARG